MRLVARIALALLSARPLAAQTPPRVQHTVEVRDPAARLFHVTSRFTRLSQATLDLALPVWTPGWYTIENYARNVARLEFTDGNGKQLPWRATGKSSWQVSTGGAPIVRAQFDYLAPALGLNQANVTLDWAFFTGTQLFLEPVGHREWNASVRFAAPAGWRVLSSLSGSDRDSLQFTARDYDELADATTQLGHFDTRRFDIEGKPHWFIATPRGALSPAQLDTMADHAAQLVRAQASVFDGTLPYSKYLYHYFYLPSETSASGGLEHASSHVGIVGPLGGESPTQRDGLVAHEYFHLWNVKRLRPAELWPYDYSREMSTSSLWVSEGFTNYFASLGLLRTGLENRDLFLEHAANAITSIETPEARQYISIADASTSTWLSYGSSQPFSVSYYAGGEMVAMMLDLAILHATGNAARLDDLMRVLWRETAARGRGFTRADFDRALNSVARRDLTPLLRRLVDQRTQPPYDSLLAFAGYRLQRVERQVPEMGMVRRSTAEGQEILRVTPGGSADRAGLRAGDVVLTVDGRSLSAVRFAELIGRSVPFTILRGNERQTASVRIAGRSAPIINFVDIAARTPAQLALRERWLGTTPR